MPNILKIKYDIGIEDKLSLDIVNLTGIPPDLEHFLCHLLFLNLFISGVVGILPTENRLPVTMGDFINLSLLSHS